MRVRAREWVHGSARGCAYARVRLMRVAERVCVSEHESEHESECTGVREGVRKRECGGARLGRARQFARFRTCVGLSRLSAPTCFFRYLALVFKEQVGGLLALLPCDQGPDLAVGHYHTTNPGYFTNERTRSESVCAL
jgi:hypothetical protein